MGREKPFSTACWSCTKPGKHFLQNKPNSSSKSYVFSKFLPSLAPERPTICRFFAIFALDFHLIRLDCTTDDTLRPS
jgi:hypothetical protein